MTLIELFPWMLAAIVALISGRYFERAGFSNAAAGFGGLAIGIVSWLVVVYGGKWLVFWLDRKKNEREKLERNRRLYQAFDPDKQYPASKDMCYECLICGNAIPSMTRQNISCKCQNVRIDAKSGQIEIKTPTKVKLFCMGLK